MRLNGYPVSPGIAIGKARLVVARDMPIPQRELPDDADLLEVEVARLDWALKASVRQLEDQKEAAREQFTGEFLSVFDAHVMMLEDPSLFHGAAALIRRDRLNAEQAMNLTVKDLVRTLLSTGDSYFQERAIDLEDIHRRVQRNLAGASERKDVAGDEEVVILADTLSPSDAAALHSASLLAFATEHGGKTSHTAILAHSLEIPAVVGVKGLISAATPDSTAIVDGIEGAVLLDPTDAEIREYRRKHEAWLQRREERIAATRDVPRTLDGNRILLTANVELISEVESAVRFGADGVGLYRSEFLFLDRAPDIPSEAQHRECYEQLADAFYPHRVVVRTFDLGGEKYFHKVFERTESNPVMGLRAIRFCLQRPEVFMPQLRSLLRASVKGNLAILVPLVTTLEEFQKARELLKKAQDDLRKEGVPFDPAMQVGIMVEVPSCALCAETFAPYVDFFSIGTNDLIQYLMAIDRNNESVASLYDPMHPAVLRCIHHVCEAAQKAKKPVTVCGEVAGEPRMIPLLIGLGVSELSMTPTRLLEARETLSRLHLRKCRRLARHALKAQTGAEVAEMVQDFLTGKKR